MSFPAYLPSLQSVVLSADALKSSELPHRELMRTHIAVAGGVLPSEEDGDSYSGMRLSVPVVGGTSAIKHTSPLSWQLSDHGRWEEVHLRGIEASYGKTPYFAHFFPQLKELILHHPSSAMEFNGKLLRWIDDSASLTRNYSALRELLMNNP